MPDLPYDIVFLIVQHLKLLEAQQYVPSRRYSRPPRQPTKFSAFATLSRAWNFAAERETFQTLHVFDDNIPESLRGGPITTTRFKQMMSRDAPRRRQIPRRIVYYASTQFTLDSGKAMTEQGRKANDLTFSASIQHFWEVLKDWPTLPDHLIRSLDLRLIAVAHEAPVNMIYSDLKCAYVVSDHSVEYHNYEELEYMNLLGTPLPRLRCISGLDVPRETRLDIVIKTLPHTLTAFSGTYNYMSTRHADQLSHVSSTFSRHCIGLRNLSTCLRSIELSDICITPSLFWPNPDEPDAARLPNWPLLEEFHLLFAPIDPHEPLDDEEQLHVVIDRHRAPRSLRSARHESSGIEEPLNQILAAAGRAVRQMPRLQTLSLEMLARRGCADMALALDVFGEKRGGSDGADAAAIRLMWKSTPPLPWTDETIAAWGAGEHAGLLKEGEDGRSWADVVLTL
ncbi:hypothetical protein SLS58_002814 [Diplodia intermedia]|uniref:DUF6546 domain-containing protein n=1 Tax=Diplodia intermedia TaxID=856260 RepID=A0ABR3TYH7_9PEZI